MATLNSLKKNFIQVDKQFEDVPKLIEWNVDMNVNVARFVGSKFLQKVSWIVVFSSILLISLLLWQIKSEIEGLHLKVFILNENFRNLEWRYERLNLQYNNVLEELEKLENVQEKLTNFRMKNEETKNFETENSIHLVESEKAESIRRRRSLIVSSTKPNITTVSRIGSNIEDLDNYRSARMRRDEGRVPLMATFLGAVPEQHVIDSAHIGPWVRSIKKESKYSFNKFHLVEDRKAIEVSVDGLYTISVQIYYFGDYTHHSYWILLNSEGSSSHQKLVKCASVSAISDREVSCYTSIFLTLNKGDRIYIQQQERNRLINLREGYSYVQLVLLSTDVKRRF